MTCTRPLRFLIFACTLCPPVLAVDWERWRSLMGEVVALAGRADFKRALPLANEAVQMAREAGPGEGRLADSLDCLGLVLFDLAEFRAAEKALQEAIAVARPLAPHQIRLARALGHLANLYRETGRPAAEAESLSREALAIGEASIGRDTPELATLLSRLAIFLTDSKKYQEAETHSRRALQIADEKSTPQLVAEFYLNAASLAYHRKQYEKALVAAGHARRLTRQSEDFRGTLNVLVFVTHGAVYLKLRRNQEADGAFEQAATIAAQIYGPEHPRMSEILLFRAGSLRKLGKRREAGQFEKQAKAIIAVQRAEVGAVASRTSIAALSLGKPGR